MTRILNRLASLISSMRRGPARAETRESDDDFVRRFQAVTSILANATPASQPPSTPINDLPVHLLSLINQPDDRPTVEEIFGPLDDRESERIILELVFLRSTAVDLAVYEAYGYGQAWDDILRSFGQHLKRAFTHVPDFSQRLLERSLAYTTAIRQPHHSPFYPVGKEFARWCGAEGSGLFTHFGTTLFMKTWVVAKDSIRWAKQQGGS